MSQPIVVTATVSAWLHNSSYGNRPQDLITALERGNPYEVINMLSFYGAADRETFADCIKVGEADVTVRLIPRDEQTRIALDALNQQLQKLRAAYMERQQEIMTQISKLQALTNEVEA
jgi:hypothetical protein